MVTHEGRHSVAGGRAGCHREGRGGDPRRRAAIAGEVGVGCKPCDPHAPSGGRALRHRFRVGSLVLPDAGSIVQARNTLLAMFRGRARLRRAEIAEGEKLCLIARMGLNRAVLLEAAGTQAKTKTVTEVDHAR